MRILDMSAGKRNVWFNRLHPDTVYLDHRESMHPAVVADSRNLPFQPELFDLTVFDPPHMVHGKQSDMAAYYGSYRAEEIWTLVRQSVKEAYRTASPDGLLAFKWNSHDVTLASILQVMEGWTPLFGHQVSVSNTRKSSTYWILFHKQPPGFSPDGFKVLSDTISEYGAR